MLVALPVRLLYYVFKMSKFIVMFLLSFVHSSCAFVFFDGCSSKLSVANRGSVLKTTTLLMIL